MGDSKIKLNTEWLSVCGGCHVSLVDMHEKILNVLESVEIQRCPLLTDIKDYPEADVGIVSGAIRNEHDREAAEKMHASCEKILAFGTCAVPRRTTLPASRGPCFLRPLLNSIYITSTGRPVDLPRGDISVPPIRKEPGNRRSRRGFTLMESLMASGILLVIVVAVTSAITAGQQHAYEAHLRIAASLAAEELLEVGGMKAAREQGLLRSEGREYEIRDGDLVLFKFTA